MHASPRCRYHVCVCVRRDPRQPNPEVQTFILPISNKYFVNYNGEAVLREACGRLGYAIGPAPTAGGATRLMHLVNDMVKDMHL